MKVLVTIGLVSTFALAAATPANAREGCGPGMHRAPHGRCVPNRGPQGQVWVAGRFYPGHGYWYNNQWYHRRYRDPDHNWRYR